MILATVFLGIILVFIEGKNLIRQHQWKELAVIVSIIALAVLLNILDHFEIKAPLQIMEGWFAPLGKQIFK
ncbi:hypothetical protein SAMN05421736_101225 [Evansella caseinilytica]|uniref:Uncharacterized protein n=1 Tax=Evansella caseinilytica TaxID=1503961 RepID=A0A1H3GPU1_9BACI|nr:hypothetical protein [Evansella caseinilytica]SDY04678.1 hypothetical protein SAMN05421736_101225 [Evansella caseinilytica]